MDESKEQKESIVRIAIGKDKVISTDSGSSNEGDDLQMLRRKLNTRVQNHLDEEIQKANSEMKEELQRAIDEIIAEQRIMIETIENEEKQAIWERVMNSSYHLSAVNSPT